MHKSVYRMKSLARWPVMRKTLIYTTRVVSAPFRPTGALPSFLIAGAMKSGTTSLYRYLEQHPGIEPAAFKEVHYFTSNRRYRRGPNWYRTNFPSQKKLDRIGRQLGYPAITGEASPAMFLHSYAMRASQLLPDAKIIMVLRNPVDRAFSHYKHFVRTSKIPDVSFDRALEMEKQQLAAEIRYNESEPEKVSNLIKIYSFAYRGRYLEQINRWLKYYPREQLLILNFAELTERPKENCNRVARFLDLPEFEFDTRKIFLRGNYQDEMNSETRDHLTEYFREPNRQLFDFLGEDWGWPS